tara:strand:+ start:16 stop:342 length:327 start_codon:yes stop_codon:yes gene_type:complete
MNCYEHTLIAKEALSENQSKELIDKYKNIISKNLGKVLKTEEWGLRTLAYRIKNNKKGFYFHIKLEGIGNTIKELEKAENMDKVLLRYLTVKVKKHDLSVNYFEKKQF